MAQSLADRVTSDRMPCSTVKERPAADAELGRRLRGGVLGHGDLGLERDAAGLQRIETPCRASSSWSATRVAQTVGIFLSMTLPVRASITIEAGLGPARVSEALAKTSVAATANEQTVLREGRIPPEGGQRDVGFDTMLLFASVALT